MSLGGTTTWSYLWKEYSSEYWPLLVKAQSCLLPHMVKVCSRLPLSMHGKDLSCYQRKCIKSVFIIINESIPLWRWLHKDMGRNKCDKHGGPKQKHMTFYWTDSILVVYILWLPIIAPWSKRKRMNHKQNLRQKQKAQSPPSKPWKLKKGDRELTLESLISFFAD